MSDDVKDEIARYRELLRRDPRSRVFAPVAEAYRKEGRLDEALAVAREGVTHHPAYAGGWLALARVRLDLGRVREAAEDLERAVAASPNGSLAWRLLGETRARLRDRGGAFEAFARALALDPLDDDARRAVLDIDSLIAPSAPGPDAPVAILSEPEELDLSLEILEEAGPPPDASRMSAIETAWLEERELSLFLVPEVSTDEGADAIRFAVPLEEGGDPVFHAGRLDILDIVHSSLAPEALADAEPERAWEFEDPPEVPPEGRADFEIDVPPPEVPPEGRADFDHARADFEIDVPPPEVPPEGRADFDHARADFDHARADDSEGESDALGQEAGESPAPAPDLRTETLADLYVEQGHVERAREIYRWILAGDPLHLRVKKKLLGLPAPLPDPGQSDADRRIADLGRWLDRARNAADRTARGDRRREKDSDISTGIVTPPPTDEGR